MNRSFLLLAVSALACLAFHQEAQAQYGTGGVRSVRNATRNFMYNRPTVSPYLNLASNDSYNGLPSYFTQVRPQVDRQRQDMAQRRQAAVMQQQLNQVQHQVAQTSQETASMMLTGRQGWSSRGLPRFGTYLNYFPGMNRRR